MSKRFAIRLLVVALWSGVVWAQGIQNRDMSLTWGPSWNQAQTIGGTGVTLAGSNGWNSQADFGYQVARAGAVSMMVDVSFVFSFQGGMFANVPSMGRSDFSPITAGLRFMVPVNTRLSFFGVPGGGYVGARSPVITVGPSPTLSTHDTDHGVFSLGGGADVRVTQFLSVRAEVRDFVTGRELAQTTGRNHLVPLFGIALHF